MSAFALNCSWWAGLFDDVLGFLTRAVEKILWPVKVGGKFRNFRKIPKFSPKSGNFQKNPENSWFFGNFEIFPQLWPVIKKNPLHGSKIRAHRRKALLISCILKQKPTLFRAPTFRNKFSEGGGVHDCNLKKCQKKWQKFLGRKGVWVMMMQMGKKLKVRKRCSKRPRAIELVTAVRLY